MRRWIDLLGRALFAVGLGGLVLMMALSLAVLAEQATGRSLVAVPAIATTHDPATPAAAAPTRGEGRGTLLLAGTISDPGAAGQGQPVAAGALVVPVTATPRPTAGPPATPTPEARLPITGLRIAGIGLETKVVPAAFVEGNGGGTWEVPAMVAGHAQFTAGAGATGNAVLLGHVDSLRSGDVFRELHRVAVGDPLEVWSGNRRFDYRTVAVWSVPRTDGTVMQPTPNPSLTIITCTGQWLPLERDFSHRLVIRAELVRRP